MVLKNIASTSNYVAADEAINDSKLVGFANSCIAEVNSKVGCNLPFFITANYDTIEYTAISDTWQVRLIEPYLSYMIMANDDNEAQWRFHYNRFIDAVNDFKSKGIGTIVVEDNKGDATGYEGSGVRSKAIDPSAREVIYGRW